MTELVVVKLRKTGRVCAHMLLVFWRIQYAHNPTTYPLRMNIDKINLNVLASNSTGQKIPGRICRQVEEGTEVRTRGRIHTRMYL